MRNTFTAAISRYQLHPILTPGVDPTPREGALLSLRRRSDGGVGYGDLHPWPELGCQPLEQQLNNLRCGVYSPALRSTISCALVDLESRMEGRDPFAGVRIPPSHTLLRNPAQLAHLDLAPDVKVLKIKIGRQPEEEAQTLINCREKFANLRLRLDANEQLTEERFARFAESIAILRDQIEFVEDPFPYNEAGWIRSSARSGLSFAVDRATDPIKVDPRAARFAIIKPAIQGQRVAFELQGRFRLIFTSYLDHPIGVAFAAWCAAQHFKGVEEPPYCGLHTHKVYRSDLFSERLEGRFKNGAALGSGGFGFEDLAAGLPWEDLGEVVVRDQDLSGWENQAG